MDEIYQILSKLKPETDFRAVSNFVDEGILDSLDIIELIDILSEKFGIEIGADDIDPDNFENIEMIWNMVEKYKR